MNRLQSVVIAFILGSFLWVALPAPAKVRDLSLECGEAHATLQCDPKSRGCTQTSLTLQKSGRASFRLNKPKGMERYTAVGLACVQDKENKPYLAVQFGELPEGCQFCEWLHIYTLDGKPLTNSQPPIFRDASRPASSALAPNNREFDALTKQLGLERPRFEFLK